MLAVNIKNLSHKINNKPILNDVNFVLKKDLFFVLGLKKPWCGGNNSLNKKEKLFSGFEAICVQHEIDHLDGKLFIDYVPDVKLQRLRKKIAKNKKNLLPTEGTTVRVVWFWTISTQIKQLFIPLL